MLAFARTQTESGTNIWAVNADGSGAVQMSLGECGCELAASPTWSPDGAFAAAFGGTGFGFSDYTFRIFITSGYQTAEYLTVGFDPSWHR
jgi:Tol biopolymer transport system component